MSKTVTMQVSAETTLTSKGQIVIAKEVRDALGLKPGDKFVEIVSGRLIHLVPVPANAGEAMLGMLKGTKFSAQEIEDWLDEGELV